MNGKQRRETDRNIRANDFLTENAADFSGNAVARAKIAALAAKNAKVALEIQNQMSGETNVRHDYAAVDDAFETLLDEMRDIRDFADSMAKEDAGLSKKFRVPLNGGKRNLIAAARVNADDAAQYKQMFIDYGLDATFIEDLRAKADAAEQALNAAGASTGDKVGATDTLAQDVKETSSIVESIDPIVRRVFRNNPTKLAAWTFASHIERHTPQPSADKPKSPLTSKP